jgi:hypothetical protein
MPTGKLPRHVAQGFAVARNSRTDSSDRYVYNLCNFRVSTPPTLTIKTADRCSSHSLARARSISRSSRHAIRGGGSAKRGLALAAALEQAFDPAASTAWNRVGWPREPVMRARERKYRFNCRNQRMRSAFTGGRATPAA